MIKVFRPFWSYDVTKTEAWLSEMAMKGYHFAELNRWTRCFFFHQGVSKTTNYRIDYDKKKGNELSSSLVAEGWIKVNRSGNWSVISNQTAVEEIKSFTVREGIIKHNRKIFYLFSGLLLYFSFIAINNFLIFGFVLFNDVPTTVVESPFWIITYVGFGIAAAILIVTIYSVLKIYKTNKDLSNDKPSNLQTRNRSEKRFSKEKEKQLKQSGELVVKWKFGWMYGPDKLEKWLEMMEGEGFNLYRVSKTGTVFRFLKGTSRKISYCADYQNISNENYFDMHREAGWKSVYISSSSLQKWTIWSQEYSEGDEQPEIYSDRSNHLKHARKIALAYTLMFLPMLFLYSLLIGIFIDDVFDNNATKLTVIFTVSFAFYFLIFGSYIVRTWLYYLRLRKQFN
ncbi:DUF2812 domain-containing protein [Bacillaceae bacterium IKA-2]|nr:DUF2812 domain-containing protein [Bacillaceae bacterium IKA-2]